MGAINAARRGWSRIECASERERMVPSPVCSDDAAEVLTSSTDCLIINRLVDDRAMIAKPDHLHVVGGAAQDGEDALDQVFSALADPVRRSILSRLDGQELLVSQIAQHFDISLQAVSKHIQVLVRAGLVAQERTGRISRCSLTAGPIFDAAIWLNRYSKYWQAQFDLLAATLGDIDRRGRAKTRSKRTTSRRKGRPMSGA
ncbi:MAG TPA: metalloregulator ArsR/SmtB family transcription factor [Casimicrobiaceae bacterium]|nr:metalloregulator ArsR/SmtB family transcription factor [Casimicrobiaceae bacterium]